jgi:hypothetical protein
VNGDFNSKRISNDRVDGPFISLFISCVFDVEQFGLVVLMRLRSVNFHHRLKHAKKTERGHKEVENINPTFLLNKFTHLNLMQVLPGFYRSHQDS